MPGDFFAGSCRLQRLAQGRDALSRADSNASQFLVTSSIALVALAFDIELYRLYGEMRRHTVGNPRFDLVQTEHLAAGRTLEMSVVVLGIALRELEAPRTVFTHDGVHQIALHQPVQHPVKRDPVKRCFLGQGVQQFIVGEGVFRIQQHIQYRNTRRGRALPNLMYHSFGVMHRR